MSSNQPTDAQYFRVYSTKIWRWFEKMRRYENVPLPEIKDGVINFGAQ